MSRKEAIAELVELYIGSDQFAEDCADKQAALIDAERWDLSCRSNAELAEMLDEEVSGEYEPFELIVKEVNNV